MKSVVKRFGGNPSQAKSTTDFTDIHGSILSLSPVILPLWLGAATPVFIILIDFLTYRISREKAQNPRKEYRRNGSIFAAYAPSCGFSFSSLNQGRRPGYNRPAVLGSVPIRQIHG